MKSKKVRSDNADTQNAYETFCDLLADFAPLPWSIWENLILDANGNAILRSMTDDPEAMRRILAAVICGVSTCGGYALVCEEHLQ